MNLDNITEEEIKAVLAWYYGNGTAKTRLKKAYWLIKKRNLENKLGWKFYMILQEMIGYMQDREENWD